MSLRVYTPEQIPGHTNKSFLFNEFRPSVLALAMSNVMGESEFVLVKSIHEDDDVWWPVQGGLKPGETPELATSRELEEEIDLKVCPDRVTVVKGMDYPTRLRENFTKGKFLIATVVEYNSMTARLKPNLKEISDLKVVTKPEFSTVMAWNKVNRPETTPKADLLLDIANSL